MIISYSVKVGDKVATGDLVCVLEAMKMQNSLPAPATGAIKAINFEPGASCRQRRSHPGNRQVG